MNESKAKFKIWNPTTKKMYGPYTIREIANREWAMHSQDLEEWGQAYQDIEDPDSDVYVPNVRPELVFIQCE